MTRQRSNAPWAPIQEGEPGGLKQRPIVQTARPYCEKCGSYAVRGSLRPGRPTVMLACEHCGARTLARVLWGADFLTGRETVDGYLQPPRPERAETARVDRD